MNLELDSFDDESLEDASSATCPVCGLKVRIDDLVTEVSGTWTTPEAAQAAEGDELEEDEEYDGEGEVWDEEEGEEEEEDDWEEEP